MRKKMFGFDIDHVNIIWVSILLPVVSVGASLGASYLIGNFGITTTIILLVAILFIFVIAEVLAIIIIKGTHGKKVDDLIESAQKDAYITAFRDMDIGIVGINGIYPEQEIAQMELTTHFDYIWLVSHDLSTEIEEGAYSGVVSQNLKKGVKYTYFVPKSQINNHRIKIIKNKCNDNKNLRFFYLDDDFFFLVPQIDFAIYEPYKTVTEGKKGYIGINIEGLSGRYETLMNPSFLDALTAKLDSIQSTGKQVIL